ncbi:MAG: alpha/beta hydrolase domain-containing protein [Actinomycetota bacterium]
MVVAAVEVTAREPHEQGRSFGDAGPYEVRRLRVGYRVDPAHPANRSIVDLEHAAVDRDGHVTFAGDVLEFRPRSPERGNGRLLVDVVNRGRPTAFRFLCQERSVTVPPPPLPAIGDGWLLHQGWTIWCVGWQFDVDHPSLIGLDAPEARPGGRPPVGPVDYTAQPPADTDRLRLALPGHRPARPLPDGPATMWATGADGLVFDEVPTDAWSFDPNGRYARKTGGFAAGRRYRIRYTTEGSPVAGCGLLALRDATSWARAEYGLSTSVLFGASQCGRVIRQVLADGLVHDEDGGAVYDGVMPLIAGARLGQFNRRFANPGILPVDTEGLEGPPTYGALLAGLPEADRPKVMALNTSAEYWRGDAALAHEPPSAIGDTSVRVHFAAGTQHSPGVVPQEFTDPVFGTTGALGFSTVDYGPLNRGLLAQLVAWIGGEAEPAPGTAPPPEELTDRATVLAAMAALGWPVPEADSFGLPAGPVPPVDADGNERGGIRMPDIAVPLGAHTGWNVRHPSCGAPDFQLLLKGATRWFPPDEIERRHPDGDAGRQRGVEAVLDRLVADRFVLDTDRGRLRAAATEHWNESLSHQ